MDSSFINNDKLIRLSDVLKIVPISRSTLWRWVKLRNFPEPIRLGKGVTVWRAIDIDNYVKNHTNHNDEVTGKTSYPGGTRGE